MSTVIFVGPHPDDIELGCGGTIAYFNERKFKVICVYVTDGGHITHDCPSDDESRKKLEESLGKKRKAESIRACKKLGVLESNISFGTFKDTCIPISFKAISFLEKSYFSHKDDLWGVFIPGKEDSHQDHRAVYDNCISAFRLSPRIYAYQSPSTLGSFDPTTFVDISKYKEIKKKALNCHKSQTSQLKAFMEYKSILNLATYHARQL